MGINKCSNFGGLAPGLKTGSELNRFPAGGKGVSVKDMYLKMTLGKDGKI